MSERTVDHHADHPVQLTIEDNLHRNRLTVAFRLILAIPHIIWFILWTIAMVFVAIMHWVIVLVTGAPTDSLHRFTCLYIRYRTHLAAYLGLVADPYPGFTGEEGAYPVDVLLPGPEPQERWKTFLRLVLALPALVLASALGGGTPAVYGNVGSRGNYDSGLGGALSGVCAVLGWFASLARGRMPQGLRDAGAYSVGYNAQALSYLLLVTDRYPNSDPTALLENVPRPPLHPVRLVGDAHDLRRSRVLVFFRLPLAIPHVVWLILWTVVAILAAIVNWFVTLITGVPQEALHRFLSRYVRYSLHVYAFLFLAANPFPGFLGEPGTYPLDLVLPPPARQNRWITGFRIILVIPAYLVNAALSICLYVAAILTWFASLATGEAPWGLRNLEAYALRYMAQYNAYLYLLTERYPHASPLEGAEPQEATAVDAVAA